jgi:hypothetical protein
VITDIEVMSETLAEVEGLFSSVVLADVTTEKRQELIAHLLRINHTCARILYELHFNVSSSDM